MSSLASGVAAALLASLSLGFSDTAMAGLDISGMTGDCYKTGNPPVSITCYGTMAGFRAQTFEPGRYVSFSEYYNGTVGFLSFFATFNGASYSCTAPFTPEWVQQWHSVLSSNAYWRVDMDTSGHCTLVQAINGSALKNASAL
jgi:hypothetical protein